MREYPQSFEELDQMLKDAMKAMNRNCDRRLLHAGIALSLFGLGVALALFFLLFADDVAWKQWGIVGAFIFSGVIWITVHIIIGNMQQREVTKLVYLLHASMKTGNAK